MKTIRQRLGLMEPEDFAKHDAPAGELVLQGMAAFRRGGRAFARNCRCRRSPIGAVGLKQNAGSR